MIFNSYQFLLFLPVVFLLYWAVGTTRLQAQNVLLLVASYVFYAWWDWRFLGLIAFSSVVDYCIGIALGRSGKLLQRKLLLGLSLGINLGLLFVFKYYNFFADSLRDAFAALGVGWRTDSLQWILPVGISFYTFQTLSYTIDVYKKQIPVTRNPVVFFAFVSFFPQLVAGPIERASALIPQFENRRRFSVEQATEGMRLILWGLFKKVLVADTAAQLVDDLFGHYANFSGWVLLVGAVLFAFQIYGDFSGYSDIAIGVAALFGFRLMTNFAMPYFSRDIAEFWRRWHISLSTWFRDYLYIPLGGSRCSKKCRVRNTFVVFLVSGLWHGANWTFVVWGALHALFFLPLLLRKTNRRHVGNVVAEGRFLPGFTELLQMLSTFLWVSVAWVFFRANNLHSALEYLYLMGSRITKLTPADTHFFTLRPFGFIAIMLVVEWLQRSRPHALSIGHWPAWLRWTTYLTISLLLLNLSISSDVPFIYFQF